MLAWIIVAILVVIIFWIYFSKQVQHAHFRLAMLTDQEDEEDMTWTWARKGAEDAAKKWGVDLTYHYTQKYTADTLKRNSSYLQTMGNYLETATIQGYDGVNPSALIDEEVQPFVEMSPQDIATHLSAVSTFYNSEIQQLSPTLLDLKRSLKTDPLYQIHSIDIAFDPNSKYLAMRFDPKTGNSENLAQLSDYSNHVAFETATTAKEPMWSKAYVDMWSREPTISYIIPIRSSTGFMGMIAFHLKSNPYTNLESLWEEELSSSKPVQGIIATLPSSSLRKYLLQTRAKNMSLTICGEGLHVLRDPLKNTDVLPQITSSVITDFMSTSSTQTQLRTTLEQVQSTIPYIGVDENDAGYELGYRLANYVVQHQIKGEQKAGNYLVFAPNAQDNESAIRMAVECEKGIKKVSSQSTMIVITDVTSYMPINKQEERISQILSNHSYISGIAICDTSIFPAIMQAVNISNKGRPKNLVVAVAKLTRHVLQSIKENKVIFALNYQSYLMGYMSVIYSIFQCQGWRFYRTNVFTGPQEVNAQNVESIVMRHPVMPNF